MKTNTNGKEEKNRRRKERRREKDEGIKRTESLVYGENQKDENKRAACWDVSALLQNK